MTNMAELGSFVSNLLLSASETVFQTFKIKSYFVYLLSSNRQNQATA